MCGRFLYPENIEEIQEAIENLIIRNYNGPNYNVCPTQPVLTIPNFNSREARLFSWGLIPPNSRDKKFASKMKNAAAETLHETSSYKTPYLFQLKSKKVFGFAGLWEKWTPRGEAPVFSCTIITTKANQLVNQIRDRMPVIIKPKDYQTWLDTSIEEPEQLSKHLNPYPSEEMFYYPVSDLVNSTKYNTPECIKPISVANEQLSF